MDGDGVNKKRGTERQLTKEDSKDDEETADQETGGFVRASEEELKTRQIRRVRRGPPASTTTSALNPFAAISLTTPATDPPVPTPTPTEATKDEREGEGTSHKVPSSSMKDETAQEDKDETAQEDKTEDASSVKPSANGESSQTPLFGSSAFTVGSSFTFPTPSSQTETEAPTAFDPSKFVPLEVVTSGEESEETVFSEKAALFTSVSGSWKAAGRGDVKINVNGSQMARLLMRHEVTLKLLLNAWLYPEMKIMLMGEDAVTFSCQNAALQKQNEKEEESEKKHDILALRFKTEAKEKVQQFMAAAEEYKTPKGDA